MLHIVQSLKNITDFLSLISDDDAVIFIDDGVYALVKESDISQKLNNLELKKYGLEESMIQRGLNNMIIEIPSIKYQDMVDLVITYDKNMSW